MGISGRKVFEKIISIFLDILIILFMFILLVFIYNNIQTRILGNDYSSLFGYSTFEVQTGSMEEEIGIGDWIIVKYTNNIQLNDVITYQKDGNFITHRVIEEYNGTYITKGDANNTKDDPVSREQIVGKVVKILPNFGIIRKTILNPYVLISLIVSFYLIGYALRSIKKDKEQIKSKEITKKIDGVLDKVFDKEEKKVSVTDKYDFIETEIDVSRKIGDEFAELDDGEEIILPDVDIEQTMYFRMVAVSKNDIDYLNSQLTASEFEIDASNISDEEAEVVKDEEVQKCVEVLNNKKKKFKSIIEKVMYIKRNELDSILNVLNKKEKLKSNESTIIDELITSYITAKYYCMDDDSRKSIIVKIDTALKDKANMLISKYKGNDKYYSDKVKKYVKFLMICNDLEQIDKLFDSTQARRENYNNKILATFKSELSSAVELKDIVNSIIKIKRIHDSVVNESINKLMSNTFNLEIQEISSKKKLYGAKLVHNINFSKVYSDYIVDKTYSEGIIAEDKTLILVTLLLAKVIRDVLDGEFKNKYIINLPESMYKKSNKLDKILSILDDDIARESIIFFNNYEEIINNKRVVKTLRKNGNHLAIRFDVDSVIKEKDSSYIGLCEYIFADSKVIKDIDLLKYIDEDDKDNIIKEDVYDKVMN